METSTRYFVADLVEEVGSLTAVAAQIVNLTSDPECDLDQLCKVILSDNVMAARFLALGNSAAFQPRYESRDLKECLMRVGLYRVRNVALLMGMHDLTPRDNGADTTDLTEFWHHGLATAAYGKHLAFQRSQINPEDAWLLGILHGIGLIALAQQSPIEFQNSLLRARALRQPLVDAELALLEYHHGELGGRILSRWNLPRVFAEAIEFHLEPFGPEEVSPEGRNLVDLLRSAIRASRAAGFGDSGDGDPAPAPEQVAAELKMTSEAFECMTRRVATEVQEIAQMLGMNAHQPATVPPADPSQRRATRMALEGLEDTLARESLEQQLEMARVIQRKLLPAETPHLTGLELAAANRPSQMISGDYYDFIQILGGATGIVVADVSGKGMPAALLASNLQASLRALGQAFSDPGELLGSVNRALFASTDPEHFATLFLAVANPDGSGFRYASAGHNPPLLLRSDGSIEWLKPAGTPLGMFGEMRYPVTEVSLEPGDLVVAYTDGVTEAVDSQDNEFTEEGLERSVRKRRGGDCCEVLTGIVADVERHAGGSGLPAGTGDLDSAPPVQLGDDLTLVLMRRIA